MLLKNLKFVAWGSNPILMMITIFKGELWVSEKKRSLKSQKVWFLYLSDDLFGQECRNLWLLSFSIFLNFLAFKRRLGRSVVIGGKRIDGICWPHTLVSAVGIDRVGLLDTGPSGFITEKLHFTLFENWKRSPIKPKLQTNRQNLFTVSLQFDEFLT